MSVKFQTDGLDNLTRTFRGDAISGNAMIEIGKAYLTFTRDRYKKFASGGGDWKQLSPVTVRRRTEKLVGQSQGATSSSGRSSRRGFRTTRKRSGLIAKILVDTGALLDGLNPGATGNQLKKLTNLSVRTGYGTAIHADSKMTYQALADKHQRGEGNIPARKIFVVPNSKTVNRMISILQTMTQKGATTK
jgi:hypothetical protein